MEGIENIGNYILWIGGIDDHYKTLNEAIEEAAAWTLRNTYPTYSKVPEAIKLLR